MHTSCLNDLCTVTVDGLRLVVRPVTVQDRDALIAGFEKLSPQSRWYRFLSPIQALPETLIRHLTEIDHENHEAWRAAVDRGNEYQPIAVARYVRESNGDQIAEMALTVIDQYHQRGIGKMLLFILAESATSHKIREFTALVHADNRPMQGFLRNLLL